MSTVGTTTSTRSSTQRSNATLGEARVVAAGQDQPALGRHGVEARRAGVDVAGQQLQAIALLGEIAKQAITGRPAGPRDQNAGGMSCQRASAETPIRAGAAD